MDGQPGYQLDSCVWELTRRCNMRCIHCGSRAGETDGRELSRGQALSVADQLLELGCRRVTLIGGEVTLYPYWTDVVRHLTQGGAVCDVITNGCGKTRKDLDAFGSVGLCFVSVSVDGFGKTHDALRGRPGAFAELERFCRAIVARGIPLTAVTTITRRSLADLEPLSHWMREQHVQNWQWQQVSPMGRAGEHQGLCLTREDIRLLLDKYQILREQIPILLADNVGYYYRGLQCFRGCAAGIRVIGLDCEGNVRGCESLYDSRFIEGNALERPLKDIWEDPNAFAYNRRFQADDLAGRCAKCVYGPVCAGGCRSFNAFHGSLYSNPTCAAEVI